MIELYQLHWSHYCEKVSWALAFKGIPHRIIDIDIQKRQDYARVPVEGKLYTPWIVDSESQSGLSDSTKIINYLEDRYPEKPLLPRDASERKAANQLIAEFDAYIGVPARRLTYIQLMLERRGILHDLFYSTRQSWIHQNALTRAAVSWLMALNLVQRFQMEDSERHQHWERLEQYLLGVQEELGQRETVLSGGFSAVDITLASLMRPLRVIPFFAENERLHPLFAWRDRQLMQHHRPKELRYETLIRMSREKRPPVRRKARQVIAADRPPEEEKRQAALTTGTAYNDHRRFQVGTSTGILRALYGYIFYVRVNKTRALPGR